MSYNSFPDRCASKLLVPNISYVNLSLKLIPTGISSLILAAWLRAIVAAPVPRSMIYLSLFAKMIQYTAFLKPWKVRVHSYFPFHLLLKNSPTGSGSVYEQIEVMSKAPKSRRSRSFSRNDRLSISHTSSQQQEQSFFQTPSGSRSRQSSEGQLPMPMASASASSRTSFEKARAIRMFTNNKGSTEPDSQSSHKRSESLNSENLRAFPDDDSSNPAEVSLSNYDNVLSSLICNSTN